MAINLNQFAMTAVQGMQDLNFHGCVISGAVDTTQVLDIVAGQALKLVTTSNGLPKVVATTADSDPVFGFALYSVKNGSYASGKPIDIGMKDCVVYMTAGGAISAGAGVQIANSSVKVVAQTGSGPRVGFALDAATADGQLIRVYVEAPSANTATSRVATVTATLAEVNAGKVLIPGVAGRQIIVTNFIERVSGAWTTGTSVDLVSDATTVNVESTATAALTNGAVLMPASANVTLGAGYGAPLPASEGLKVQKTGSNYAGGTSITFTITYSQA